MAFLNVFFGLFKSIKRSALVGVIVLLLSSSGYAQTKDILEIQHKIEQLQPNKRSSKQDTVYINLLNKLARKYRFYNQDSLFLLSRQALTYSISNAYKEGECVALLHTSMYYSDIGKSNTAIESYLKALKIANQLNKSGLILKIQNRLATEYSFIGDNAKALNIYLTAVELAKKDDNKNMQSVLFENIGSIYASQKDYVNGLAWYKRARSINKEIGNEIYMAETMSNIASLYNKMENYEKAMFNANRSISIFEKNKISDWLAYAYSVKGNIYLKQEKYKWSLYWFEQSKMLHKAINDERGKIILLKGLAEAHLGQKNDSLSKVYALEGYKIAKKLKDKEGQKDCAKALYEVEKIRGNYEMALQYHEVYQKMTETLAKTDSQKGLSMLKVKMEYENQKKALIFKNKQALTKQQGYVNATLLILAVFIISTLVVYYGRKKQRELNIALKSKKIALEDREKELSALNETKNKLFSIIGHDLRGPIGALQSLLKLFNEGEIKKSEFFQFMPKLTTDVNHISFTLNNLLSWGQTQMNGAVTRSGNVLMENLVVDNMNLLSEMAHHKSIRFINKVQENTIARADIDQVDIVVRNLLSNAIKFTPKNGMITITSIEQNDSWVISVRDTGVGMKQEIKNRLFKKSSNITTYGTNNEKGTGLGLSLCKEMVENNGGEIWVDSVPKKGSTFYFSLPKSTKNYQKTA